jgi:hypothetical protein
MSRLIFSSRAFLRSIQMSKAQIFGFVEGGLDRPFVERMLGLASKGAYDYRVCAIKELPGGTGGKQALIGWFKHFRRKGVLGGNAWGKKYAMAFFADKDADDFIQKRLRSKHFIYSETYDIEGHLFRCGDLVRALADAAGLTVEQARGIIYSPEAWLSAVARKWADWIVMCLFSQFYKINVGCTFDRFSVVNPNPLEGPDPVAVKDMKDILFSRMTISRIDFDRRYDACLRKILKSIESNEPLRYFKGKWLKSILQTQCESGQPIPDALFNGIGEKILSVLIGQVASREPCKCSGTYVDAVRGLATTFSI